MYPQIMVSELSAHSADHSLVHLVLYLIGILAYVALYQSWQRQRRDKRRHARIVEDRTQSRQNLRYKDSTLFEVVMDQWHGDAQEETFHTFNDRFDSYGDVANAMSRAGMSTDCHLIMAVDFTASNEWQGRRTLHRHCLHDKLPKQQFNPYQQVIAALGETLAQFSSRDDVHAFGFGDATTHDKSVFYFRPDSKPCRGFGEVLTRYTEIARRVRMSGPTNYAPVIRKAVRLVQSNNQYHVLIIITDGQLPDDYETTKALIDASAWPLSIIIVGVGDGPWDRMEEFDDMLPARKFDNLQFADFNKSHKGSNSSKSRNKRNTLAVFALHALMELPDQYKAIKQLKLM